MQTKLDRKYRPGNLDEVVSQKHVVVTLKNASAKNLFTDAYLFVGQRGCGKTSMARMLAMLLTCENVKDGLVCGECEACTSIRSDCASDVLELDGATKAARMKSKAFLKTRNGILTP